MSENRLQELLTRYHAQTVTLSEMRELYQLLHQQPDAQRSFEQMNLLAKLQVDFSAEYTEAQLDENWKKVQQGIKVQLQEDLQPDIPDKSWVTTVFKTLGIAASVLLLISAGLYFFNRPVDKHPSSNVIVTKKGSRSYIVLSDGTKVWLNADSRLTCDKGFGDESREVFLTGEAFFEVHKDAARPFIVHTKSLDIRVMGTVFNVSAYEEDKATTATLLEGSIKAILNHNAGKEIILKPKEKLVVRNEGKKLDLPQTGKEEKLPNIVVTEAEYLPDSSAIDIQWTNDKLAFKNTRLDEIALLLERWYGTQVKIEDASLKSRRFSGVFQTETLQQVVEALAITGKFNYSLKNNELTIDP